MNVTILANEAAFPTVVREVPAGSSAPDSIRRTGGAGAQHRLDWYGANPERATEIADAFFLAESGLPDGAGALCLAFDEAAGELTFSDSIGEASGIGYTVGLDIGPTYACKADGLPDLPEDKRKLALAITDVVRAMLSHGGCSESEKSDVIDFVMASLDTPRKEDEWDLSRC